METLMNSRLDEDESFIENFNYLQNNLHVDAKTTERKLRITLEEKELELNQQYLENIERINTQVQSFVEKIRGMSSICRDLTDRIQSNKEKTRELLKKTSVLQNEKKHLDVKKTYLDEFFGRYSLTEDEERALNGSALSDSFFKAFARLTEIQRNVVERVKVDPENLALMEMAELLNNKLDGAYQSLYGAVQRECRLLNVEFIDLKAALVHAFELLQSRPELFEKALEEYGTSRRSFVVRAYIDILTKGAKTTMQARPIEQLSNEPLRYVNEMLSWIQGTVSAERDLLASLLRGCHLLENIGPLSKGALASITETLCQPLRLRVEQCITKEGNCVVLYRLSTLFLYYANSFESMVPRESLLVVTCLDLHDLTSNMFFSAVNSTVQRILANVKVPDYDLLPVNAINQALLLLRDILESQNDGAFSAIVDKREMYAKIFMHILDPLHQSIQLVCSNLDNPLDVAVFMLNCLNAIRSVIILYQFCDVKLEMIKAQIDANEDVLVSEQASHILEDTEMMQLYSKSLAHQPNQGPLSKIAGMESDRVQNAVTKFNAFLLKLDDGFQCSQTVKIASARIRDSVRQRTLENVLAAYRVIWTKVTDPANEYPTSDQLKTIDDVAKLLQLSTQ